MPISDIQPPQIPQTGIGLLDALLRAIRQDPFGGLGGGLGTLRGSVPGDVTMLAEQMHPNLFRALAQRPEEIFVAQNQPLNISGRSGLFDLLKATNQNPDAITQVLGPAVSSRATTAPPGSAFMAFQPNPNLFAPTHESLHILDFLRGLFGYPPEQVMAALGTQPIRVPMSTLGEKTVERMAENSVAGWLGFPRYLGP